MKVAVIFNGQGAHYPNMGLDFQDVFPQSKEIFDKVESITGMPIREWIESDQEKFKETRNAQVAIAGVSMAIYESIKSSLPAVTFMGGLSLGEYSALMASGMLGIDEGFKLLQERGELMSQHCKKLAEETPAQMLAVINMPYEEIEKLVDELNTDDAPLFIANINSSSQVIIAGTKESTKAFRKAAREAGYRKVMPLKVEGPFHSPLMSPVCKPFEKALEKVTFSSGEVPVISNTTVKPHTIETVKPLLVNHLVEPVRWRQTIDRFNEEGITHIIQIGPGDTLFKLLSREENVPKTMVVDKVEDVSLLKEFLTEE